MSTVSWRHLMDGDVPYSQLILSSKELKTIKRNSQAFSFRFAKSRWNTFIPVSWTAWSTSFLILIIIVMIICLLGAKNDRIGRLWGGKDRTKMDDKVSVLNHFWHCSKGHVRLGEFITLQTVGLGKPRNKKNYKKRWQCHHTPYFF